jgi:hypothetical protein
MPIPQEQLKRLDEDIDRRLKRLIQSSSKKVRHNNLSMTRHRKCQKKTSGEAILLYLLNICNLRSAPNV